MCKMHKNQQKNVGFIGKSSMDQGMEIQTYTLDGIKTALEIIYTERDKLYGRGLISDAYVCELLTDIENAIYGDLEIDFEIEDVVS